MADNNKLLLQRRSYLFLLRFYKYNMTYYIIFDNLVMETCTVKILYKMETYINNTYSRYSVILVHLRRYIGQSFYTIKLQPVFFIH